jgi:hypothetical protein
MYLHQSCQLKLIEIRRLFYSNLLHICKSVCNCAKEMMVKVVFFCTFFYHFPVKLVENHAGIDIKSNTPNNTNNSGHRGCRDLIPSGQLPFVNRLFHVEHSIDRIIIG